MICGPHDAGRTGTTAARMDLRGGGERNLEMLVLTRKPGESIRIGNDVTIMLVSVDDVKVRLGIEAPKDILILREELVKNKSRRLIEAGDTPEEIERLINRDVEEEKADYAEEFQEIMGTDEERANMALVRRAIRENIPLHNVQDELDWRDNVRPNARGVDFSFVHKLLDRGATGEKVESELDALIERGTLS
jgi:carbon storage regulator